MAHDPERTPTGPRDSPEGRGRDNRGRLRGRAGPGALRAVPVPHVARRLDRRGAAGRLTTPQRTWLPTSWTFSMFVVVRPAGEAAAITTDCPRLTRSRSRMPSSMSAIMSSVSTGTLVAGSDDPSKEGNRSTGLHVRDERV